MMDRKRIMNRILTVWLTLAACTLGTGAAAGAAEAMAPETGAASAMPAAEASRPGTPALTPAVADGLKRLYAGDLVGAAERFSAAADAEPGNAAARYYLGYAHYRMGDFARARAAFAAAYEADPDFSPDPPKGP